jgi:hypothetical protein
MLDNQRRIALLGLILFVLRLMIRRLHRSQRAPKDV